jgi:hypothetical protein
VRALNALTDNITVAWPCNPHELAIRANTPGLIGVFPVRLVVSGPRRSGDFDEKFGAACTVQGF